MADNQISAETVPAWRMLTDSCLSPWIMQSPGRHDFAGIWQARAESHCDYYSLMRPPENNKASPLWDGISRFGIRDILGLQRFESVSAHLFSRDHNQKIEFSMPAAIEIHSEPYLDFQISAGIGVFRFFSRPLELEGPIRLQDQNLGRFPPQLPSVTLEY